nr:competence type IV pilus minor pilin ComGD [Aquibacillus albus]
MPSNKQSGFTLIEVIIVLSMISFIISIGGAFQYHVIDQYKTRHFIQIFQDDILYMQKRTTVTRDNIYMVIEPEKNLYVIKQGPVGKSIVTREIPKTWDINLRTLTMPISFTTNGTIKNPGTFTIDTTYSSYDVSFPFGKGRCYIIEK